MVSSTKWAIESNNKSKIQKYTFNFDFRNWEKEASIELHVKDLRKTNTENEKGAENRRWIVAYRWIEDEVRNGLVFFFLPEIGLGANLVGCLELHTVDLEVSTQRSPWLQTKQALQSFFVWGFGVSGFRGSQRCKIGRKHANGRKKAFRGKSIRTSYGRKKITVVHYWSSAAVAMNRRMNCR